MKVNKFTVLSLVLVLAAIYAFVPRTNGLPLATLHGQRFLVEVARTDETREVGLSGRAALNSNEAMLFVFDSAGKYCFWMKDMKFNIDILWFDADKHLIYQERDASPQSYPNNFCTPGDAMYILEVASGTAQRLDLKDQDTLTF